MFINNTTHPKARKSMLNWSSLDIVGDTHNIHSLKNILLKSKGNSGHQMQSKNLSVFEKVRLDDSVWWMILGDIDEPYVG